MRALVGTGAVWCTWALLVRVLAAGRAAQRRADRLDARAEHAKAMRALRHAVTPTRYP